MQTSAAMEGLWFAFLCLFAQASKAKVFSKCELYKELKKNGMDNYHRIGLAHCKFSALSASLLSRSGALT